MSVIETEIKFRVADSARLEQQLNDAGFHLATPRSFESNTLYDTPERHLRAKREILRIRDYAGRWLLTHKRIPDSGVGEDKHKHRVETETDLSDGKALADVFASIGLFPAFRYEKWRTEWEDSHVDPPAHCVIDETPLGVYAELEGPSEWIEQLTGVLGVSPDQQLTLSYGRLFEQWKEQTGSTAQDMTFAAVERASAK